MKTITVYFDDKEFDELKQKKGTSSWHDFIMQLLKNIDMEEHK